MRLNLNDVVFEKFDDEIVAINLKTGIYYSISGSGLTIWDLIDKNMEIGTLKKFFKKKFPEEIEIESDIDNFIKELVSEKLVVSILNRDADRQEPIKNGGLFEGIYRKPLLEKYTDQQELLLLDPIHEVDDFGWPRKK